MKTSSVFDTADGAIVLKIWVSAVMAGSILCAPGAATGSPTWALDWCIEVTNTTRMAIIEFYAAPVRTQRWGQDLLGDAILPAAGSARVSFDYGTGSCRFDLKVVFDDGSISVRRDVNICLVERYAISYH